MQRESEATDETKIRSSRKSLDKRQSTHRYTFLNIYIAPFSGKVYICGGFNGHECLSTAEAYDPFTNQWTLLEPMRNRRSGIGVIAYKDEIYALGGFNGITRMNTGEKYCPKANRWKTIPEMFNPRSNFAIEVYLAANTCYSFLNN